MVQFWLVVDMPDGVQTTGFGQTVQKTVVQQLHSSDKVVDVPAVAVHRRFGRPCDSAATVSRNWVPQIQFIAGVCGHPSCNRDGYASSSPVSSLSCIFQESFEHTSSMSHSMKDEHDSKKRVSCTSIKHVTFPWKNGETPRWVSWFSAGNTHISEDKHGNRRCFRRTNLQQQGQPLKNVENLACEDKNIEKLRRFRIIPIFHFFFIFPCFPMFYSLSFSFFFLFFGR